MYFYSNNAESHQSPSSLPVLSNVTSSLSPVLSNVTRIVTGHGTHPTHSSPEVATVKIAQRANHHKSKFHWLLSLNSQTWRIVIPEEMRNVVLVQGDSKNHNVISSVKVEGSCHPSKVCLSNKIFHHTDPSHCYSYGSSTKETGQLELAMTIAESRHHSGADQCSVVTPVTPSWRMLTRVGGHDSAPSRTCSNTFIKMMTLKRGDLAAMFLSSDQCFRNPVPPQYPLHFSRQQPCRKYQASPASQAGTPRTVAKDPAKAAPWTTGCPSFLPSTSQNVRWCFSQNHYKVTTSQPATMTKTFYDLGF